MALKYDYYYTYGWIRTLRNGLCDKVLLYDGAGSSLWFGGVPAVYKVTPLLIFGATDIMLVF